MPRPKKTAEPAVTPPAEPVKTTRTRLVGKARISKIAEVKRIYRGGASITETAKQSGMSYGFCQRELANAGVKIRAKGGSKSKAKK